MSLAGLCISQRLYRKLSPGYWRRHWPVNPWPGSRAVATWPARVLRRSRRSSGAVAAVRPSDAVAVVWPIVVSARASRRERAASTIRAARMSRLATASAIAVHGLRRRPRFRRNAAILMIWQLPCGACTPLRSMHLPTTAKDGPQVCPSPSRRPRNTALRSAD